MADKSTKHKCDYCDRFLASAQSLKNHQVLHTGQDKYRCKVCEKGFQVAQSLREHMFTHGGVKPFKCNICDHRSINATRLKIHSRVHTGERPYKCGTCGSCFKQLGDLKGHKLKHEEKKLQCNLCDRKFRRHKSLRDHIKTQHSQTKRERFPCNFCQNEYFSATSLKRHFYDVHSHNKFSCELCHTEFSIRWRLKKHIDNVHSKTNFQCYVCKEVFSTNNNLLVHMEDVHYYLDGQKFPCDLCKNEFSTRSILKKHTKDAHSQLVGKKFPCDVCRREFSKKGNLEKHMGSKYCKQIAVKRNTIFTMVEPKMEITDDCSIDEKDSSARNPGLDMQVYNEDEEAGVPKRVSDPSDKLLSAEPIAETLKQEELSTEPIADHPKHEELLVKEEVAYAHQCDLCTFKTNFIHSLARHKERKHRPSLILSMPRQRKQKNFPDFVYTVDNEADAVKTGDDVVVENEVLGEKNIIGGHQELKQPAAPDGITVDENALICIQSEIVVKVENHVGKEVIKEAYHTYTEVVPAKNTKWQVEAASDAQGAGGSGNHGCKKKSDCFERAKGGFL